MKNSSTHLKIAYPTVIALLSLTAFPTFSMNNPYKWTSESSVSSVIDNVLGKSYLQKKLANILEDFKVSERLATESLMQSISTDLLTQQNPSTIFALKRLQAIALIVSAFSAEDNQIASIKDINFKVFMLTKQQKLKKSLGFVLKKATMDIKNTQDSIFVINELRNALVTFCNKTILEHQKLSIKLQKKSTLLTHIPEYTQNCLSMLWLSKKCSLCDQLADPTLQTLIEKQDRATLDTEHLPILIDQTARQIDLLSDIINLWEKQI
ncbi:TPA: hypothetical protein DDZ86_02860 [Candidatus Dependentiae bacterium]|nr:MAG: hypothetical protein UW09_C0001G0075 [candidate division TM6 bacterium GW2011_GWF2_43_87]HBL98560.1 hypothetical protein [Candidatus Dependentiae bacterium]